jgi:7-dehydrocholesterol reductase
MHGRACFSGIAFESSGHDPRRWETGYWKSMDIQHDRAGYYICWGCLNWVPSLYTSHAMFLVKHPMVLGPYLTAAVFLAGVTCIYINYDSDRQRQVFRYTGAC